MTGEKNRYKPLDKLAGLNDKQLKTPKHDEMILWLLNMDNIKSLFKNEIEESKKPIFEFKTNLLNEITEESKNTYQEYKEKYLVCENEDSWNESHDKILKELKETYDSIPDEPDIKLISEAPIVSGSNNFIIGYWDLKIILHMGEIREGWDEKKRYRKEGKPTRILYIEVKPKIESFGETLRQLRTYQQIEGLSRNFTYLFSGDDNFKDAFESQGIKVILTSEVM